MKNFHKCLDGGFSLAEVMVAVGVFAFSIVGIVGLLGSAGSSVSEVSEIDDANRVAAAVQAAVQDIGLANLVKTTGYPYLRSVAQTQADDAKPLFDPVRETTGGTSDWPKRYTLFANRSGSKIGLTYYTSGSQVWLDKDGEGGGGFSEKFFEITLIRNENLSPATNDATAGFVAYTMRIRWPAFLPNGVQMVNKDADIKAGRDLRAQQKVLYIPGAVYR